jgi:hypothetical protein
MLDRSEDLQGFLDAAFVAFDRFAVDIHSRNSIMQIFGSLEVLGIERTSSGKRLPVCDQYLQQALDLKSDSTVLKSVAARFGTLERRLEWKTRTVYDNTASGNFLLGHANAMIVGPGGLEERDDVWLGVSLMAPHVRYPDHDHSPEETYLVLTDGEFMQEDHWFVPGVGGSFYNPSGVRHAMLSKEVPLFAFWALRPAQLEH